MTTIDILRDLIAFPTVSIEPNKALIDYAANILHGAGAKITLVPNADGTKANLFATIGPMNVPGVMLSGHTDVVPVEGQNWSVPPFAVTERAGHVYGRGTADMKGFVAAALRVAQLAGARHLKTPLHIALSYDEEIGCVGVRSLIEVLALAPVRPMFCIVGEPTSLNVATGHKGKVAAKITCWGREGHSAMAPQALNAIHLATDMITAIRGIQKRIEAGPKMDPAYDVPYSTLHIGKISGGVALNIVPNRCTVDFEIRNISQDDPKVILADINAAAARILGPLRSSFPEADIVIEVTNRYPALYTPADAEVVDFVKSLTGSNGTTKVSFGTEGGLFSQQLSVPTVICGPGSMEQGHKPDEFILREQLDRCDAMLDTLLTSLEAGI